MADQPPSYEAATSTDPSAAQHRARNGIPAERRRSMEDEARPLPAGWVRQYDSQNEHQFFVDTRADPPRSIWHHPFDDEQYLSTLPPDERENATRLHHSISLQDIAAESSDDDDAHHGKDKKAAAAGKSSSTGTNDDGEVHGLHRLGRRIKDRVTHTDHQQRMAERERRAERERQAYAAHLAARRALSRAIQTGEPQFLCKDRDGKDVYILPPPGIAQRQPFPSGAYGYNPYNNGPFAGPNARFLRPQTPYSRPYGYGYGGGYGFPLMGGFLGGAMLGSLMF